jgi:hypothetical protein
MTGTNGVPRPTVTLLAALIASLTVGLSQATSPPDGWVNERIIECDGAEVRTFLTPAGFGTPFNVVGSSDVIVPKYVQVTTVNGDTFTTLDVPGFDPSGPHVVACAYTDPAGLVVEFLGIRTGRTQ